MQIILLILVYFLSAFINNPPLTNSGNKKKPAKINCWGFNLKRIIPAIFFGTAGVLMLDLASQGQPLWPALAFPALVVGEIYPPWKTGTKANSGTLSYFGGVFYLNPGLALISLGLALEILLVGKDKLLAILVFTGLTPVLIRYAQMNPVFFWAALGVELIILWEFKRELLNKIKITDEE